ncbi:MAG: trypsin-like serine protease [Planctomycetota bacterium]
MHPPIPPSSLRPAAALTAGLLGVFALVPVEAGTMKHAGYDDIHQLLAQADPFESVGQISGTTTTSSYTGSGVYLGDGWVLTAAHVVDQASELDFDIDGQTYTAEAWAYHSDWDPSDVAAGADIALIKLTEDVSTGIDGATLYTGTDEVGSLGISVGYGLTGTGLTGYDTQSSLDKRAGTNVVDEVYGDDVLLSDFDSGYSIHNSTGSSDATILEYLIAPGDSGGGLFIYDESINDWSLAGINSFGLGLDGEADSDFSDISGQTRVSSYDDWITDVMAQDLTQSSATLNSLYSEAVFTVVPEPTAASFVALLALACLARRDAESSGCV